MTWRIGVACEKTYVFGTRGMLVVESIDKGTVLVEGQHMSSMVYSGVFSILERFP